MSADEQLRGIDALADAIRRLVQDEMAKTRRQDLERIEQLEQRVGDLEQHAGLPGPPSTG